MSDLASSILERKTPGQPVASNPTPSTPSSAGGIAGTIKTAPPGPYNFAVREQGAVNISRYALLKRSVYQAYLGPLVTPTSVAFADIFPYVLAETVPPNKFWIVLKASGVYAQTPIGGGNALNMGLWLMPPGSLPAPNNSGIDFGTDPDHAFADYGAQFLVEPATGNGPPPRRGIRIDQTSIGDQDVPSSVKIGEEVCFIRSQELYVPEGWTLMGYSGIETGTHIGLGNRMELRLQYAEFDLSEDSQSL